MIRFAESRIIFLRYGVEFYMWEINALIQFQFEVETPHSKQHIKRLAACSLGLFFLLLFYLNHFEKWLNHANAFEREKKAAGTGTCWSFSVQSVSIHIPNQSQMINNNDAGMQKKKG